jgi:hypothetical protein
MRLPLDTPTVIAFVLGILLTIVLGIIANLLTPGVRPLWATLSLRQTRQNIKVLERQLEQYRRFKASERAIYVYLFQWLFSIIGLGCGAGACAVIAAFTAKQDVREFTAPLGLALLVVTAVCCLVVA